MNKTYALTAMAGLLLSACSHTPIPVAANHAKTYQFTMQAAHHWDVLAGHTAQKIYSKLQQEMQKQTQNQWAMSPSAMGMPAPAPAPMPAGGDNMAPDGTMVLNPDGTTSAGGGMHSASFGGPTVVSFGAASNPGFVNAAPLPPAIPALYVAPPHRHDSDFGKGFYNLLQSRLIQQGLSLVTRQDGPYSACYSPNLACKPLTVRIESQVVHHKDRDSKVRYPGRFTVGAAALGGAAYFVEKSDGWDKGWTVLPLAMAMDAYTLKKLHFPEETASEVIITTSVADGELLVFSDTSIYYINTGDDDHYDRGTATYKMVDVK